MATYTPESFRNETSNLSEDPVAFPAVYVEVDNIVVVFGRIQLKIVDPTLPTIFELSIPTPATFASHYNLTGSIVAINSVKGFIGDVVASAPNDRVKARIVSCGPDCLNWNYSFAYSK